jgi:hypothetical protein
VLAGAIEWLGFRRSGSGGRSAPLLEALPAKDWTTLRRLEGDGSLLAAARTIRPSFHLRVIAGRGGSYRGGPFGLAGFATFRFVLELLVVEEQLFTSCKHEVGAAVYTLQNLVLEFHGELLPSVRDPELWTGVNVRQAKEPD